MRIGQERRIEFHVGLIVVASIDIGPGCVFGLLGPISFDVYYVKGDL